MRGRRYLVLALLIRIFVNQLRERRNYQEWVEYLVLFFYDLPFTQSFLLCAVIRLTEADMQSLCDPPGFVINSYNIILNILCSAAVFVKNPKNLDLQMVSSYITLFNCNF